MKKELKDLEGEIWREVPDGEGYYLISTHGRVKIRSRLIDRKKQGKSWSKEKIMSTPLVGNGYPSFMMNLHGKSKRLLVHRVVGLFWCENPENKPCINHKDGNKLNNHFSNLEWVTQKENINHAFDTGLNIRVQKNNSHRSKPVIKCDNGGVELQEYPSLIEVQRTEGFKYPNIHHAIKNKIKSNGYYWKYKN